MSAMGVREMRTYWPSTLAGFLCALVTVAGVLVATTTERQGLGALLIVGGFGLLLVVVAVAARTRKPGQPL